ncbi:hypothetical protein BCR36DRAFT_581745 [Piromyces finnis]|uniref:GDP/GTP exchange factor Sec2 N-terminal domain-containing protein n=1 Tax=Piromyces finnis TaxID=1754191 RepID=A0A1Y1VFL3_9FUNG|nr:hypothetical protein BCR36DRAFT_581745 [Piromyces finnis]|eukprot:ORX54867.1 hypothetical protein BCR36DRAFT_581745 [Piromyces finnis]
MNNSFEEKNQDDNTSFQSVDKTSNAINSLNKDINKIKKEIVNETKSEFSDNINNIPHIIKETVENKESEKMVKEKGPGIDNNKIIIEPGLKALSHGHKINKSIGASSQSSLSTSAIPVDILDEYDSDTSEFPTDYKHTTDMLIKLKERILDESKKMLTPADSSSRLSHKSSLNSETSSLTTTNNLSSSYTNKLYVPNIRYNTNFPNKSYTDVNISSSNINSYTYHNNISQESFSSTYLPGNINTKSSLSKYRKIFEYTEDEIKLFNALEEYALLPKGRLNPGLDDLNGDNDEINKLKDEQVLIYKKLNSTRSVLHKEMLAHVNCINEKEELEKRVQELQNLLEEKEKAIEELQAELNTEKGSAESLKKERQTVQDEVEELTKSLFEEANKLVADEARKRHKVEKINKIMSGKLRDSQLQLDTQTQQLKELRKKMEEINFENITNKKMMEDNKRLSILSEVSDETIAYDVNSIDTFLLAEFKDFISSAFNVRMSKLHNIPYMKNCLEDDIMPCLRFGSDPKISWKRLTEEIASNSLLLQEISSKGSKPSSPQANRPERSSSISMGSLSSSNGTSTPTYQNTPQNRSSMWARLSVQAGFGSGIIYDQVINGCQACGRPNTQSNPIRFQFRIDKQNKDDSSEWSPLCSVCRDRIVACCEFYNFIRHIRQGLYTNRGIAELYYENIRLKRQMFYARVGALNQADFDYGFGKLPKLTQSTTTYKRSLSISQIKSEFSSSSSSLVGNSISSPISQSSYNYPTTYNNDSSNSSVTQVDNTSHRVLNLDTYKPPINKRSSNTYLPSTVTSPEYNSDNVSSIITEDAN